MSAQPCAELPMNSVAPFAIIAIAYYGADHMHFASFGVEP